MQVAGELLSICATEEDVHTTLGVEAIGDCTRVVMMVESLNAGRGMPKPVDITKVSSLDKKRIICWFVFLPGVN